MYVVTSCAVNWRPTGASWRVVSCLAVSCLAQQTYHVLSYPGIPFPLFLCVVLYVRLARKGGCRGASASVCRRGKLHAPRCRQRREPYLSFYLCSCNGSQCSVVKLYRRAVPFFVTLLVGKHLRFTRVQRRIKLYLSRMKNQAGRWVY